MDRVQHIRQVDPLIDRELQGLVKAVNELIDRVGRVPSNSDTSKAVVSTVVTGEDGSLKKGSIKAGSGIVVTQKGDDIIISVS